MKTLLLYALIILIGTSSCRHQNLYPKAVSVRILNMRTGNEIVIHNREKVHGITDKLSCRYKEPIKFKPRYRITIYLSSSDSAVIGLTGSSMKMRDGTYSLCERLEMKI